MCTILTRGGDCVWQNPIVLLGTDAVFLKRAMAATLCCASRLNSLPQVLQACLTKTCARCFLSARRSCRRCAMRCWRYVRKSSPTRAKKEQPARFLKTRFYRLQKRRRSRRSIQKCLYSLYRNLQTLKFRWHGSSTIGTGLWTCAGLWSEEPECTKNNFWSLWQEKIR